MATPTKLRFLDMIHWKKQQYIFTLDVDGVSKIFSRYRLESCFWLSVVLSGVFLSAIGISSLILKYYRYEIYTSVSTRITHRNYFPSLTFCDKDLMSRNYFTYCRIAQNMSLGTGPCYNRTIRNAQGRSILNSSDAWSNGVFVVTRCRTLSKRKCAVDKYMKSLSKHNHTCFTWNYDGSLYDANGYAEISFQMDPSLETDSEIIVMSHDPRLVELQTMFHTTLLPYKHYELKIQKTEIKRLKYPFPSNCTDEKAGGDIFPGKYSRISCMESVHYIKMLKQCGDIFDYIKRLLPRDMIRMYVRNVTAAEASSCMKKFSKNVVNSTDDCPVPCQELELYTVAAFYSTERKVVPIYSLAIQLDKFDSYRVIEEKQLYSWDQIAGEIGGLLGLFIGASFVSAVELIVYMILTVIHKVIRRKIRRRISFNMHGSVS